MCEGGKNGKKEKVAARAQLECMRCKHMFSMVL